MSDTPMKEYSEITEYGYIKDEKVFLKGYYHFKDREIGVVRESDEESLRYFVNRFDMVTQKVNDVKDAVANAENKGSYLMKLIHMRTYLAQYNGLGDFTVLFEIINSLEDEINAYIEKNREKNYNIKSALLKEAEEWRDNTDWKEGSEKFKELKMNWIKTGSAHKEHETVLSEKFNKALEAFYENRTEFFKQQAEVQKSRTIKYQSLLNQVKRINRIGGGQEFVSEVKDIQREWKFVGQINKRKFMQMSNDFRRETSKFYNSMKFPGGGGGGYDRGGYGDRRQSGGYGERRGGGGYGDRQGGGYGDRRGGGGYGDRRGGGGYGDRQSGGYQERSNFQQDRGGDRGGYNKGNDNYSGGSGYDDSSRYEKRKSPLEMKKELLDTAELYLRNGAPFNISNIKSLQNNWKSLGKQPSQEDKELNLKFRIICNEIFESHFLERTAKSLQPDLYSMSDFDQLKVKLDLLRDSIRQDEQELLDFNTKHGTALMNGDQTQENYALYQERNNYVNKLKTKQRILQKLEDKLLSL